MNDHSLLFFVCVGNVFAAIPKSKTFVATHTHEAMCQQAKKERYDFYELLAVEKLLQMLDPMKGRAQVETVFRIFQNRPETRCAIVCYGPHVS